MDPATAFVLTVLFPALCLAQAEGGEGIDNADGASGSDQGAFTLSHGGIIAIIVVVVVVALLGSMLIELLMRTSY